MLQVSEYVERVVIVLNPDRTLKAAHQESIKEVRDDGTLISANPLGAKTVEPQTLEGIVDASALIGQVDALADDLAAVTAERDAALSQVTPLQQQVAALQAEVESLRNPWGPRRLAPYDFLGLLTPSEIYAMQTSVDPTVIVGRTKLQTIITFVDLDNPETIDLVQYLEVAGLIGEGRAAQILAGEAPPS